LRKRILLVSTVIVLTVIISFVIFDQVNKSKELKALETQVNSLELKVQSLFTTDHQDELNAEVNDELLSELKVLIDQQKNKEMPDNLSKKFNTVKTKFNQADLMYKITKEIDSIYNDEGLVKEDTDIQGLKDMLAESQIKSDTFKEKQLKKIKEAEKQIKDIKKATKLVESLFNKEDQIKSNITKDDVNAAEKAIKKVKHKNIVARLEDKLKLVHDELTNRELAMKQKQEKQKQEEQKQIEQKQKSENESKTTKDTKQPQKQKVKPSNKDKNTNEETESHNNSNEIGKLEEKLYQLQVKQINLETEANKYPQHSEEYRALLEESIDVLHEMDEVANQLNKLY